MKPHPIIYSEVLAQFGLVPTVRGPWAAIGHTNRLQGWKLHLSSVPTEAVALLSVVVPFLSHHGVAFKVAKDQTTLSRLNEGEMGPTQVGKFLTIYPRSDEESRYLADTLVNITRDFRGPAIVSDLRVGEITYTRYGGFNPIITRDRLGQMFLSIYGPDGTLRVDSQTVPFSFPQEVPNPFSDFSFGNGRSALKDSIEAATPRSPSPSGKLFGPGYLILGVVSHRSKGSVFRAIDLRSQAQVSLKIIKQGRQHCLSDECGRDIRTRLRHQEALHNALAGLVPIARADPYFEVLGDGYLPLADIEGETIESFVVRSLKNRAWSSLSSGEHLTFLMHLDQLVTAVQQMHATGYVHRDLSASNIWIGTDNRVYLLDLELAHRVEDKSPVFGLGTLGFMSPAQEAGEQPTFADDIYALGCVMTLFVTGLDPRRVLSVNDKDRIQQLQELTNGAPFNLVEAIAQCVKADPAARPILDAIKAVVQQCLSSCAESSLQGIDHAERFVRRTEESLNDTYTNLISGGQEGLLQDVVTEGDSRLWMSAAGSTKNGGEVAGSFQLYRDAHRGVAGVVYLLGRLARFGHSTTATRDRVREAAEWLLFEQDASDVRLPGLYFGDAGVAVAIVEAIAGGLINRDPHVDAFLSKALVGRLDWPDITHGAAGQGVAAIYCADRLRDASVLDVSHRCAAFLVDCQKDDGSWEMPAGVDGMSGETLTGFAHGVSGIVYFLAEYARCTGSSAAFESCEAGIGWLMEQAIPTEDGQALEWQYSNAHQERWKWWCHGSPGIALTFLRMFEQTGNGAYAETARKALRVHPVDIRYPNLSQCHGLSGLAEIYLEAARVLGDREWYDRAQNIAAVLVHLRRETDAGSITWLVENPHLATADLMVGSSGVIHLLLRLSVPAKQIGFPLLLDPIPQGSRC
jgi:serine/threonine protein kinase